MCRPHPLLLIACVGLSLAAVPRAEAVSTRPPLSYALGCENTLRGPPGPLARFLERLQHSSRFEPEFLESRLLAAVRRIAAPLGIHPPSTVAELHEKTRENQYLLLDWLVKTPDLARSAGLRTELLERARQLARNTGFPPLQRKTLIPEDQIEWVTGQVLESQGHRHTLIPENELRQLAESFANNETEPVYAVPFDAYLRKLSSAGFEPTRFARRLVIDVGAGLGNFTDFLARVHGVSAYGVDACFHPKYGYGSRHESHRLSPLEPFEAALEQYDYAHVRARATELQLEVARRHGTAPTNLPFESGSAAAVVSHHGIDRLPWNALGQALGEMLRVLEPGGRAYLVTDTARVASILGAWKIPYQITQGPEPVLVFEKPAEYRVFQLDPR